MRKTTEHGIVFLVGSVGYTLIEILWRGFSHWTMTLTGGVCMVFVYVTEYKYRREAEWKRYLADTIMITLSELSVGFVVNILLGWKVWDYSGLPLNFFGQVCALYSGLWFLLCIPVTRLCTAMHRWLHRDMCEKKRAH